MRMIALPAIGIAITACAGFEESSTAYFSSTAPSSGTTANYSDSAPIQPDAVVDANHTLEEGAVCRREAVTGTRILRERCHVPPSEAEAALEEEITRAQLDQLREQALWEERQRMERMGLAPPRRPVPVEPQPSGN